MIPYTLMKTERPYIPPRDNECFTPSIIPEKVQKTKIAPLKLNVEEISNEILQICEMQLNLPIARFYVGGALYSEIYSDLYIHIFHHRKKMKLKCNARHIC